MISLGDGTPDVHSRGTQMDAGFAEFATLGIATTPYTDPQTLTFIKAIHFTALQARAMQPAAGRR
jgi:hypothetical protein